MPPACSRYRTISGKSGPGEAYMLSDILRTDGHRFRPLMPMSDDIKVLRALIRGRDDQIASACPRQPAPILARRHLARGRRLRHPVALAFVARYTTLDSASRLGEKRLASFMAQPAYCGRRSRTELVARLHAEPRGLANDAEVDAKSELVRVLPAVLEHLVPEIAKLSSHIEHAVA